MRSAFVVERPRSAALRALNYSRYAEAFQSKRRHHKSVRLGDVVETFGSAFGQVFTRHDCHPDHGIELLSQADMFAAEPAGRVIRKDSMPDPEKHRVRHWQVLIAGAGTLGETELYGRSIVADARLVDKYVGPHAMVLSFRDPGGLDNLYTYAFLCTFAGMKLVRSASYGTKILGVRSDILANVHVPQPDDATKATVSNLIRKTVEQRGRFLTELQAARRPIEELPEMVTAVEMCGSRRAQCVLWDSELSTLSAWMYASTGGAIGYLREKWSGRLRDVLEPDGIFNGPRFARVTCRRPYGVDFLSQRHVFLIRPVLRRIVHPGFSDRLLFVRAGSLLIGGHGTLGEGEIFGRVAYVTESLARCAFTQDLLRVQPREEYSPLAYSFLSTMVGFRLLRSTAVGTKLMLMRPDLLGNLPFPDVEKRTVDRVNRHLKAAMAARQQADAAETEAIRIIEEEVLSAWLS